MLKGVCVTALIGPALMACSDSEDSGSADRVATPPAYYRQLAAVTAAVDDADTAADEELNAAVATTDPTAVGDLFAGATEESADRLEAAVGELARLKPPSEAVEAHQELVDAARAELALSRELAASMAGLSSDELGARSPLPGQARVEARTDAACAVLQGLADAAGAGVRLCVGTFAPPRG